VDNVSDGSTQSKSIETQVDLKVVCVIVGALALFAPILVSVDPVWGFVTIMAMTWTYYVPYGFSDLGYILILGPLPFTVWRVVFVYQMVRYFRGRSTRGVTFLLGVLAEIPLLVLYFIIPLLFSSPTMVFWSLGLTIPTPLMLTAASVFLWMTPFPVPKTPFDDQPEPDRWWREKPDTEGFFMFRTRFLGG